MEILLLFVVITLLIYLKVSSDSRHNKIDDKLRELHRDIDYIKQNVSFRAKPVEQPKSEPVPIPVVEPEKPVSPPVIPVTHKIPEPQQTAIPIETIKPAAIVENRPEKEKPVLAAADSIARPQPVRTPTEPYIPQKSWWENFKDNNPDLEKFIGENLINKIGVLILVLGISYFVKYAIDKDWINEPARVGIGILCGALVMGFAHKLRKNYAAFSSVLVAGAIAIFYFTIGIAFHDYHLFSQTVAFIIMVVITAFSAMISLSYNRKELAVLSLIGGFAVPFMVSTGQGNYIVLFTYITILDIGILALAYHKKWNIINILSYAFTVILYAGWLIDDTTADHPHYAGALLFGFIFYFVFILINIINNLRTKGAFSVAELTILVSNTFLFYGAGMYIMAHFHPEYKGLFTTVLGLLNLTYAWFLYKKFGLDKTAVYLLIGLTLTFITLAIPIQFEGNSITLFWAGEAVLLMWLAQKSKIIAYRFSSVIVHVLMLVSLFLDWKIHYTGAETLNIIANPACVTGIVAVISVFLVLWLLKDEKKEYVQFGLTFSPTAYSTALRPIGFALAYFVGLLEVYYQAYAYVDGSYSAFAFPVLWHLSFCAGLFYFLCRSKNPLAIRAASILAAVNIVLFAFWFSNAAFEEHRTYIATGVLQRIAFYLHYISLAIVVYFGYGLYQINKGNAGYSAKGRNTIMWISAFFVVFIASTELTLHGLVISNTPVTLQDLKASDSYKYYANGDLEYLRRTIANSFIGNVKDQIFRTGFPILWGILAFIFLIAGIKIQNKSLRIIALSLLGITILKLFLFDIRNASETGKIIAFILLGVLILIISFVYQKIKVLVLSDAKPEPTDETD